MGKMKELDILSRNAALSPCDWCDKLVNRYDFYHKGGECREEQYTKAGLAWRVILGFAFIYAFLVLFLSMPIK